MPAVREKTAIFGGTFNPIHMGHIRIAHEVMEKGGLDRVLFVPAGVPPWKFSNKDLASAEDRLHMVSLALEGEPGLKVTDLELCRKGPSYTLDTVRILQQENPEQDFCFLLGMDAMAGIRSWHGWEELLSLISFWVMTRPDTPPGILERILPEYSCEENRFFCSGRPEIRRISVSPFTVSATEIRLRISEGLPVTGLVPDRVDAYIRNRGLYAHV
ncbi:nicotinate-nucleotide adenylyltransferase [Desulfobotulus mexicanus]|uniref:Probable nicotinate-nucleotide adenylyltransferase n=1 Tax=Desulfobotulus mexicanus TaxID=2586642 RepID=A0A5Q4VHL0_9BACT|nr:nicotinate-nucleotide adenylyltransferase [Desulfobotulus mexicanus]TYT76326.1 nicotinate (nicotinamide) nucleotide adenylyltransferase [Desulfobotulus mexicanus]